MVIKLEIAIIMQHCFYWRLRVTRHGQRLGSDVPLIKPGDFYLTAAPPCADLGHTVCRTDFIGDFLI